MKRTIGAKSEHKNPAQGFVVYEIEVLNQDDKVVQKGQWNMLIRRRAAGGGGRELTVRPAGRAGRARRPPGPPGQRCGGRPSASASSGCQRRKCSRCCGVSAPGG